MINGTFYNFCHCVDDKFFRDRKFFENVLLQIDELISRRGRYLSVSLPQGSGKSYLANLITCYLGLLYRAAGVSITIMRICNTNKNTIKFKKQVSAILESPATLQFFGRNRFNFQTNTQNEIHILGDILPFAYFYSVGTSTMSQRCDVIIYDDLYESMAEAMSPSADENLKIKHQTEWVGRLDGTSANLKMQISVGTRYTKNDFYQYFCDTYSPMTIVQRGLVDGKSFCEKVKSTEDLISLKSSMNPDLFNSVVQQAPSAEGLVKIFEDAEFEKVDFENHKFIQFATITDPSRGRGGDYFVTILAGITIDGDIVVIDSFINQYVTFSEYYEYLGRVSKLLPTCNHFIEGNGVGADILADQNKNIDILPFHSSKDKVARIYANADEIKRLKFCKTCDNLNLILSEVAKFPAALHDDIPDALNFCVNIFRKYL